MNRLGRTLSAVATTIGLAVGATGCGSNVIGADGPRPGVAAEVEGDAITLDDLQRTTDGLCTLQEADPQAIATSRQFAQGQILQAWVLALVRAAYAEEHGLEVSPADPRLEQAPGWDDVDEEDRDALRDYVDAFVYADAVTAAAEDEEPVDPSDFDVTINPRFDVALEGEEFVAAGDQLSVPVSEEGAVATEPPSPEVIEGLSDAELCGKRPAPQVAPPIPLG